MRFQFFAVSALSPEVSQQAINAFCAKHRVVTMEKQFVALGTESFWSVCVTYIEGDAESTANKVGSRRERIDYKEVLNERDFSVYAELRNLRKSISEQEGVPAYALFTNEQLAEMVTRRVNTQAQLGNIDGVGKGRMEKYGAAFVRILQAAWNAQSGKNHIDEA